MNRLFSFFFTIAIVLILSGCQKKPVNGQVFIVTQGAESHKLALVPVYYLNEDNIKLLQEKLIAEVKALKEARAKEVETAAANLKEAMNSMTACSAAFKVAKDKETEIEAAISANTKRIPPHKPTPDPQFAEMLAQQITEYYKIVGEVEAKDDELKEALNKQSSLVDAAEIQLRSAKTTLDEHNSVHAAALAVNTSLSFDELAGILEGILPQFTATTKTDIDGKFTLSDAVSNKRVLVSFAKRMTGAKWEMYVWAGVIPAKLPNNMLMLSNDNLLPKDKLTEVGFTPSEF